MEQKEYSRRKFIHQCAGSGAALLGTLFLLNSCGSNEKPAEPAAKKEAAAKPADPCSDFSGVSAEELEKRKNLGYTDKSTVPENSCGNCGLYIPPANDTECGRCLLFKGPVRAEGHCVQYVAKTT
jgi:hypothetical protein